MTMMTKIITGDQFDPRSTPEEHLESLKKHLDHAGDSGAFKLCGVTQAHFDVSMRKEHITINGHLTWFNSSSKVTTTFTPLFHLEWLIDEIVQDHNQWDHDGTRWFPRFSWDFIAST